MVEERLSERFDPVKIEEREQVHRATTSTRFRSQSLPSTDEPHSLRPVLEYVIDGRRNPELFLPHELFDSLLTGFTPDESLQAKQREFHGAAIRAFGFDEIDFWNRLSSVAYQYVRLKYGSTSAAEGSKLDVQARMDALCRARYAALQRARQMFGHEHFDRFLYTVIAPTTNYASATTHRDPAVELRRADGGCQ